MLPLSCANVLPSIVVLEGSTTNSPTFDGSTTPPPRGCICVYPALEASEVSPVRSVSFPAVPPINLPAVARGLKTAPTFNPPTVNPVIVLLAAIIQLPKPEVAKDPPNAPMAAPPVTITAAAIAKAFNTLLFLSFFPAFVKPLPTLLTVFLIRFPIPLKKPFIPPLIPKKAIYFLLSINHLNQ